MPVLFKPAPVKLRIGKPLVVQYQFKKNGEILPEIAGGATGDAMSDFLEAAHLNFFFRGNPGGAVTSPASIFLALLTAAGSDSALGTEVTNAGAYARTVITFGAPASGVIANALVTFPTASANWSASANIVGWAITDSGTFGAGNILTYGTFTNPQAVLSGNTPSIAAGALTLTAA